LSGAGAALHGGRFNRPGVPALYLSLEPETALAEYRQGSSIVQPATLAAYIVDLVVVADLSSGHDPADWAVVWTDWDCDWRWIARVEKRIPPSWLLGDAVIRAGCAGLLFPSTQHAGGTNLVVFGSNLTGADSLAVHDPDGRLPTDARSWPVA
jgi:RES domain-containing protein